MRYYIFFIILYLIICPTKIFAQKNCLSCHNSWYNEKIDEASIHAPFLHGNCNVCHSKSDMENSSDQDQQISDYNWILSKYIPSGMTLIPLSQNKNLLLKLTNEDKDINKTIHLKVTNFEQLSNNIDFSLPVVITNFHVVSITTDYMVHAKIVWNTNIPTKCSIYYGISKNDKNISNEYLYSTNHILEIDGLKKNTQYYLYIVAESPINEKITSSTISFNTSANFDNSSLIENSNVNQKLDVKIINILDKRYIEITSPTQLYLKIALDNSNLSNGVTGINIADTSIKPTHLCSSEIYELGYKKCLDCHNSSQYDHNSHPINIMLPPNMHPPKKLILVNGKITCITCHCPHASNYPHQLRMKETTLCGCCHDLRHYAGLKIAQQYRYRDNSQESLSNM